MGAGNEQRPLPQLEPKALKKSNLEGNATTGQDTSLFPRVTYPIGPNYYLWAEPDSDAIFSGWSEQGNP
jgi:hypothetical protein